MNHPEPNDWRDLIGEIIAGIRKLEQGTHMKSLMWLLIVLTVTNVIIATAQIILVLTLVHR